MTYLKCAAVTVQKAVRRLAARRVLQQLLQKAQAAAQTKEEEAAKKVSPPGKMMLRDRGLNDLAKFARRSAKKARRVTAKAHDVGAAVASLTVPEPGWSAETEAACLAVQMAWRRHCARRQLVLKKKCRAQGLRRGIGSMGYAVMKGKQGRAGVPGNLGERNVGHPYRPRSALVGRVEKKLPRVLYRTATGKRCRCTTPIRDTTRLP